MRRHDNLARLNLEPLRPVRVAVRPSPGIPLLPALRRRRVLIRTASDLQLHSGLTSLGDVARDLRFSPNGQLLAVLHPESLSIVDVAHKRLMRRDALPAAERRIIAGFTFENDALILVDHTLQITVRDIRDGKTRDAWSAKLDRPQPTVFGHSTVAFHAQLGLLALATDGCVSVWDTNSRRHLSDLRGHTFSTVHPAFSTDGTLIVSAGSDGRINVWDARTLILRKQLRRLEDSAFSVALSPDTKRIAVGRYRGETSTVTLIDVETGRELLDIPGSPGLVSQIAWSPDGTTLLARLDDGRAWRILPTSRSPTQ
jgi:WD40 repeat protein